MLYIVVNSSFAAMSPEQSGFNKTDPKYNRYTKVGIFEEEVAKDFAEYLSGKHQQRFYLAQVTDYVQPAAPPLKWDKVPGKEDPIGDNKVGMNG